MFYLEISLTNVMYDAAALLGGGIDLTVQKKENLLVRCAKL